jgi:hypothetical protein
MIGVAINVTLRFVLVIPLVVLDFLLIISIIGLPIGVPLGLWLGKFMGAPINRLKYFHPDGPTDLKKIDEDKSNEDPNWFVNRDWSI